MQVHLYVDVFNKYVPQDYMICGWLNPQMKNHTICRDNYNVTLDFPLWERVSTPNSCAVQGSKVQRPWSTSGLTKSSLGSILLPKAHLALLTSRELFTPTEKNCGWCFWRPSALTLLTHWSQAASTCSSLFQSVLWGWDHFVYLCSRLDVQAD